MFFLRYINIYILKPKSQQKIEYGLGSNNKSPQLLLKKQLKKTLQSHSYSNFSGLPINILKTFIDEWKNGHDLIYGVRKKRKENFLFTFIRKIYYKIMNESSQNNFPEGAGGFRLIDKTIINRISNNNNISNHDLNCYT